MGRAAAVVRSRKQRQAPPESNPVERRTTMAVDRRHIVTVHTKVVICIRSDLTCSGKKKESLRTKCRYLSGRSTRSRLR